MLTAPKSCISDYCYDKAILKAAMPLRYVILDDQKLLLVRGTGIIEKSDLADFFEDHETARRLPEVRREFIDLAGMHDIEVRFLDVMQVAKTSLTKFAQRRSPVTLAFYAPTGLAFGMARMFEMAVGDSSLVSISVFETVPEALQCLGLPEDFAFPEGFAPDPQVSRSQQNTTPFASGRT